MPTYEVCLAITSYAYIDVEAPDQNEAMRIGAAEWEAYTHEADNPELTGIGCGRSRARRIPHLDTTPLSLAEWDDLVASEQNATAEPFEGRR